DRPKTALCVWEVGLGTLRASGTAHWDVGLTPGRSWSDHDGWLREDLLHRSRAHSCGLIFYLLIKEQSKDVAARLDRGRITSRGKENIADGSVLISRLVVTHDFSTA